MNLIKKSLSLLILGCFSAAVFAEVVPIEDLSKNPSSNIAIMPDSSKPPTSAAASASTASLPLDKRVSRLEQQIQAQSESVQQVDLLRQQLQELQGKLEEQQHELQKLRDQLNNFYADLDQRISGTKGKTAAATTQPITSKTSDQEQQLYNTAFNLLKNGKYNQAIPKFKDYLKAYPKGKYAANSHYWLGEIYYLQSDLKSAASEFQTVTKNYPDSPKAPDAMFKVALIHYDQGQYTTARNEFTNIKKTYPDSSVARLADQQLKKMNARQI